MYIVVIGGGQVGTHLAKALLAEGHEVLIIERNEKIAQDIANELGSSVAMRGDGCEVRVLTDAGTSRADMLVAVTGDDEDNLVSCQVAKHKFAVPRTLARVSNPRNEPLFRKLGVDVTVSSTSIILEYIEHEVPSHPLMHLMLMRDRGLEVLQVAIPTGARSVGKRIGDLMLPSETVLSLIIRRMQKPIVPSPDTMLEAEDQIIAVAPPAAEPELRAVLTSI
jgi:trk system potassium uptake protein TrkA